VPFANAANSNRWPLAIYQRGAKKRKHTTLYGDLGNILMKLGRFAEARRYADSCLLYCQLEKYPPLIMNAYALIYTIEEKAGDYKEAIAALKEAQAISDSLTSADRIKVVNELENKYDQAKNEKTILELSQQKKISLLMAGMALLVAISIAFFLRQQTLKHRQKVLETEQRLNRARMNPHFFFNALASLQTMAVKNEDGKALAMNLSKFSHIMRETLESTYKEYVTVEQEIDFLNEYLTLQKIRFPEKFEFQISCAGNLEPDAYMIPSMIIQPFAENAVEHGFQGIQSVGKLHINFSIDSHSLKVTITDNGKGLADAKHIQKEHISRASQIIKDRIYLLNLKLKTKASFSIDNRKDTDGVEVIIYLPIIESNDITDY
jgi:LytS/YehU family sensor histidine kinase